MTMITENTKGGTNARWIAMRCKEEVFHQFLHETFGANVTTEEAAIEVVKVYGGVESRAEFDTNPHAAFRFHNVLRRPYSDYLVRRAARQARQFVPA